MSDTELCNLTIAELGEKIAGREISPVEVTEAHLERIYALNPTLNAFYHRRPRTRAGGGLIGSHGVVQVDC